MCVYIMFYTWEETHTEPDGFLADWTSRLPPQTSGFQVHVGLGARPPGPRGVQKIQIHSPRELRNYSPVYSCVV